MLPLHTACSEEHSVTSTQEVCPTPKKERKTVSFLSTVTVYLNQSWCREECMGLWYSMPDLKSMKRRRADEVRHLDNFERKHHANLYSYRNVFERVYQQFCLAEREDFTLCPALFQQLRICAVSFEERLGLESQLVFHEDRHLRHKELLETIGDVQSDETGSVDVRSHIMSKSCQELSRPSRLWAQHLAQALAPDSCLIPAVIR